MDDVVSRYIRAGARRWVRAQPSAGPLEEKKTDTRRAGLGRQRSREERKGCPRSERRALRAQVGRHPLPASQVTRGGKGPFVYRALWGIFLF